jgi:hypothetical protein
MTIGQPDDRSHRIAHEYPRRANAGGAQTPDVMRTGSTNLMRNPFLPAGHGAAMTQLRSDSGSGAGRWTVTAD